MPVINNIAPLVGVPPEEGPCSWPINTTCVPEWDTYPLDVQAAANQWAIFILWALTGRQYGTCQITIRPCGPKCLGPTGYLAFPVGTGGMSGATGPWMIPWIDNGVWRNCGCTGGCTCRASCEVPIPGPVASIDEVRIDGVVLDSTAYRLDYFRGLPVLVRTDGGCWPDCQDMDADNNEAGAFAITYHQGIAVPYAGQLAAGQLAGEFAKACSGQACVLPQQLSSLSRNGIEVQVVDPNLVLDSGLTGIANVDLWIRAVNPARKAARSRVLSPDLPAVRRTL